MALDVLVTLIAGITYLFIIYLICYLDQDE